MKKLTMEEMHSLAKKRGGKCLSKVYKATTKLKWQCSEGHKWRTTPHTIKSGSWCPVCGLKARGEKRLASLEPLIALAKERGGKCLSKVYENSRTHLEWQCAREHTWLAKPNNIKAGRWCPTCGIQKRADRQRGSLDPLRSLAKERGGKCLSRGYENAHTPLEWQCSEGHKWHASPDKIKNGSWCSRCAGGRFLGETLVRITLEHLLQKKFNKVRKEIPWLKREKGSYLELDGYCKDLNVAFEHQGRQHFRKINHFHKKNNSFKKRLKADQEKIDLCKKNGVKLIIVPEVTTDIGVMNLKSWLTSELNRQKISFSKTRAKLPVDYKEAYTNHRRSQTLALKAIANELGGKLLTNESLSMSEKVKWQCAEGHRWWARPYSVKAGCWCLKCSGSEKLTMEEMHSLAKKRGGKCLSKVYENSRTHLEWQCAKGHKWHATPNKIKRGRWCPTCTQTKPTIEEMRSLAKERGGKCLSRVYENAHTHLEWQCAKGHKWHATPNNIKRGKWCPTCARRKNFMRFKEARNFVRKLNLKSQVEWYRYCTGQLSRLANKPKPEDIPAGPNRVYRGKGWLTWGDWLGKEKHKQKKS